jgi:hypothetical protein
LDGHSQVLAHLPAAHLSDHPGGVEALMNVLTPGLTLPGPLLVLQQRRLNPDQQPEALTRWAGSPAAAGGANSTRSGRGGAAAAAAAANGAGGSADSEPESGDEQEAAAQHGDDGDAAADAAERRPLLLVSRKQSLLAAAAAGSLPASASEVAPGTVLPGYVASITSNGGGWGLLGCLFVEADPCVP